MENYQCPKCTSYDIGNGVLQYATMTPPKKLFSNSMVLADLCTNCGYILEMRVNNPKIFKDKKKEL